jgi:phenylacetate-CoA ligase
MGIDFRIRDFAHPLSILKLKRTFDRNQWLNEEALSQYQSSRLRQIITHAYHNVPYYQKLFRENGILPDDVRSTGDLRHIPCLTKELLRLNFESLVSRDAKKFRPKLLVTSGTSGGQSSFYVDKPSNVLEFVHYWRSWGWAGYRLGDVFAELSAEFFTFFRKNTGSLHHFSYPTRKLTLNSLLISSRHAEDFIGIFRRYRPLFLKGIASNLYMLALVLNEKRDHGASFRAVFSQGENLLPYQRELIERVFSCKVFDSYGHMERTVAVSQCQYGTYHIHLDYGIAELEEPEIPVDNNDNGDACIKEIVGTSLYNRSMPLIRYRTRDLVKVSRSPKECACGRGFPSVISVLGRDTDVVITPDGRAVTALYTVFDRTPGIVMGQIIQEEIDRIVVRIVHAREGSDPTEKILAGNIRDFVGADMKIRIEPTTVEGIRKDRLGKFKVVMSNIPNEKILGCTPPGRT